MTAVSAGHDAVNKEQWQGTMHAQCVTHLNQQLIRSENYIRILQFNFPIADAHTVGLKESVITPSHDFLCKGKALLRRNLRGELIIRVTVIDCILSFIET